MHKDTKIQAASNFLAKATTNASKVFGIILLLTDGFVVLSDKVPDALDLVACTIVMQKQQLRSAVDAPSSKSNKVKGSVEPG